MQILVLILVVASLVQLVELLVIKTGATVYGAMEVYLALNTTNCAILAVTLKAISNDYNFLQSIVYALGSACGFLIAMTLMAGIRERIKSAPVPNFVKGTPILFVAAGLLSMAFAGFAGLIK